MNKLTLISIIIAAGLIGSAIMFSKGLATGAVVSENNVTIVDGVQIVELFAKGGYSPQKSVATSGIPTILRITTSGTFDCSSIIRVPALNITKTLPPTGSLDIDLGIPKKGVFTGSCGMGMYPFEIDFQ
jgi:plastocyanin domain-containing protein